MPEWESERVARMKRKEWCSEREQQRLQEQRGWGRARNISNMKELDKQYVSGLSDCQPMCAYFYSKIRLHKNRFKSMISAHRVHLWGNLSALMHMVARAHQPAIDILYDSARWNRIHTPGSKLNVPECMRTVYILISKTVHMRREKNPHTSRALSNNNKFYSNDEICRCVLDFPITFTHLRTSHRLVCSIGEVNTNNTPQEGKNYHRRTYVNLSISRALSRFITHSRSLTTIGRSNIKKFRIRIHRNLSIHKRSAAHTHTYTHAHMQSSSCCLCSYHRLHVNLNSIIRITINYN